MRDSTEVSGWLLVAGPVLGLLPVAHPALVPIWSMPREDFIAAVAAHRVAWAWLNAGFALATIATTAGLITLGVSLPSASAGSAVLACAVAYGIGGGLWCAVLAVRTRTTPLQADLGGDMPTSRETALIDAATGGMFQAFVLISSTALCALGLTLLLAQVVAAAVAVVLLLVGAAGIGWLLTTGDLIPALLYTPTLLLGLALLVGWSG